MELKTISASKFNTFLGCPRRYYAENVEYVPAPEGSSAPAQLGTVVHNALQTYVEEVFIHETHQQDEARLIALLKLEFMKTFRRAPNLTDPLFKDAYDMTTKWFYENNIDDTVQVLSVEKKQSITINTIDGPRTYNYIFDRLDLITHHEKTILRVVDYKTWRKYLNAEQMREHPQSRMYGFAANKLATEELSQYKIDEIWVCLDQVRYAPVEVHFTREDNLETWKFIKETAAAILSTPDKGEERLNPECQFCVRKTTCKTLTRNAQGGGIFEFNGDRDEMARRRMELESANKATKYALDELDNLMLADAMETEEISYATENFDVEFKTTARKSWDPADVKEIVGETIFSRLPNCRNPEMYKLLDGDTLTVEQKRRLRAAAKVSVGDAKPKITPKIIK